MDRQQFLDQRQKESCDAVARETAETDREFKSLEAENGVDSIFNLFDRRLSSEDEADEPKSEPPIAPYRLLSLSIVAIAILATPRIAWSLRAKPPKSLWSPLPPSSHRISTLPRILEEAKTTPRPRRRWGIARRARATRWIRSEW